MERDHCNEALLMLRLGSHPRIVPLRYCIVAEGDFLMFTTLVDGLSLNDAISTHVLYEGTVAQVRQRIASVLEDVACGLAYCHSHRVTHQDLKQPNTMIDSKSSRARLVDFGLSAIGDEANADLRTWLKGFTEGYNSPEVKAAAAASARDKRGGGTTGGVREEQMLSPRDQGKKTIP